MTVHLRPATEADLADIVDVSTAAFPPSVDAIVRRLFPGDLHHSEGVRKVRLARKSATFQLKSTVMMLAVDDNNGQKTVVGYSIWEIPVPEEEPVENPKGKHDDDDDDDDDDEDDERPKPPPMAQEGMDLAAFAELRRMLGEDVSKSFGERGTSDVWTLDSLGVHPQHQKKGIGKMLLDWGMKEAAKQGRDCYLVATPAGLPLYRAAGFEDVRIVDIFGTPHVSMRKRNAS